MIGQKKRQANSMPVIDEGWWVSVLTEEGRTRSAARIHSLAEQTGRPRVKLAERKSITNWELVRGLFARDDIVELVVVDHNRGGLLVEGSGVFGFVPVSHLVDHGRKPMTDERDSYLESYVGRKICVKVIECDADEDRVVFSERAAQARPGTRTQLLHSLQAGQSLRGEVTNVTDFGVFVDLGGVEGLIHISELSWGRVAHPSQIAQVGDSLEVRVLELEPERSRVALSLKRLKPNPWENAVSDFPVGETLPATITTVLSFGAFARLNAGVEGLIHVSEIPRVDDKPLKDVLEVGQAVQVRILHVDALHHRMGLSMNIGEHQKIVDA